MNKVPQIKLKTGVSLGGLLARFHMTIFVVLIIAAAGYAVLVLNSILNDETIGSEYTSPISAGSIDQATLDRVNALHRSNERLPGPLPSAGRTNPFAE